MAVPLSNNTPLTTLYNVSAKYARETGRVKTAKVSKLLHIAVNTPAVLSKTQFYQIQFATESLRNTLAQQETKKYHSKSALIDILERVARQKLSPDAAQEIVKTERTLKNSVVSDSTVTKQKTVHFSEIKSLSDELKNVTKHIRVVIKNFQHANDKDFPSHETITNNAVTIKILFNKIESLQEKMDLSFYNHHPAKIKSLQMLSRQTKQLAFTLYTEYWQACATKEQRIT